MPWYAIISLLGVAALLAGCETHKEKPWEHTQPKWYEFNTDPDDRAFYRDFLFGR